MIFVSDYGRRYLRERSIQLMADECIVVRQGDARVVYDRTAGRAAMNAVGQEIYRGPCRLWEIPGGGTTVIGDEEITVTTTQLSIPYNAPVPEPEDQIKITKSDDPSLVGRYVKVLSVKRGGGLRASRVMAVQFLDTKKVTW